MIASLRFNLREFEYFTSRDLLEKLMANDSLRNDNGVFENFYAQKSIESAGPLSVSNYILQTDYSSEAVETTLELLNDALDSLLVLDSLVLLDTIYLGQQQSQGMTIHLIIDSLRNQSLSFLEQKDSLIAEASTLNSSVIPSNDIELYEKQVNEFHFAFQDSSVTLLIQSSLSDMIFISSLCPYAYGKAVFRARSELIRYGIESNYDDKLNCAQLGYLRLSQHQTSSVVSSQNEITIYPQSG